MRATKIAPVAPWPEVEVTLVERMLIISRCPFCRRKHWHGAGIGPTPVYGHRVSHCTAAHLLGACYILVPKRVAP